MVILLEQQWAEVSVMDDNVKLLARLAMSVEHEGFGDLVTVGKKVLQQGPPGPFADIPPRGGVFESGTRIQSHFQFVLVVQEQAA